MRQALLGLFLLVAAPFGAAKAEEPPTFRIEFADGVMTPKALDVPANVKFEIQLVNKGQSPAEFESKQLRKEKVIAPGETVTMVIRGLDPGDYDFFDDFHPDAQPARLTAK